MSLEHSGEILLDTTHEYVIHLVWSSLFGLPYPALRPRGAGEVVAEFSSLWLLGPNHSRLPREIQRGSGGSLKWVKLRTERARTQLMPVIASWWLDISFPSLKLDAPMIFFREDDSTPPFHAKFWWQQQPYRRSGETKMHQTGLFDLHPAKLYWVCLKNGRHARPNSPTSNSKWGGTSGWTGVAYFQTNPITPEARWMITKVADEGRKNLTNLQEGVWYWMSTHQSKCQPNLSRCWIWVYNSIYNIYSIHFNTIM